MKKKTTIQDIADALGISRNTVSKAINNTEGIADATRDKILQKAVEMGYKQFSYVRTLSDSAAFSTSLAERPDTPVYRGEIALLTTIFLAQSHFASLMLDKFQREMAQMGYALNMHRVTEEDMEACRLPVTLFPERCSGMICFEVFNQAYADMLCTQDIPILFVDGPARIMGNAIAADQLYMDNKTEITRFINEMLKRGYTRIGWIGNFLHCQSFYERYTAYRTAMAIKEIPVDKRFIIVNNNQSEMEQILGSMTEFPDVFICANDFAALDAMRFLEQAGKRVPEDVMLLGFDDSPESRSIIPRLSTIHIHTQIMAFSAVHLLISRMHDPSLDFRTIYTETDLIWRKSTDREGELSE